MMRFSSVLLPKVEETVEESLSKLWDHEELGDRKPTDFLHHLQTLARKSQQTIDSPLIRSKFISSMPTSMRAPLAVLRSAPVRELAEAADSIWASNKSSKSSSSNYVSSANAFDTKSIASEVAAILSKGRSNQHPRRFNNQQHNQHQNHRQSRFSNHSNQQYSRNNSRHPSPHYSRNRSPSNRQHHSNYSNPNQNIICFYQITAVQHATANHHVSSTTFPNQAEIHHHQNQQVVFSQFRLISLIKQSISWLILAAIIQFCLSLYFQRTHQTACER